MSVEQSYEDQLAEAEAKVSAYMKTELLKETIDDLHPGLLGTEGLEQREEDLDFLRDRIVELGEMDLGELFEDLQDYGHDVLSAVCFVLEGSGLVDYDNLKALKELVFLIPTGGWDS